MGIVITKDCRFAEGHEEIRSIASHKGNRRVCDILYGGEIPSLTHSY